MTRKIDRVGEINYNKQNEKMIIISYKNNSNIDVQFEDGSISYNKYYSAFKKGEIKHPIRYKETIAYYIEVELGLNLDDIWNWEKNKVNPYETTKQSNKKIWLYCQKYDYHNYDREGNKIGYEIICSQFYKGSDCSYCSINKLHIKDSLAYNYPQVAKMIAIKENNLTFEDCYNISCFSGKKFYFKCLECNKISDKKYTICQIVKHGYSCKYCSDGISIPNKFIQKLLSQLDINYSSEYSPYYFKKSQRVDIFIQSIGLVIEMDGNYGNHTIEYDYWRDFLNIKYGGYKTIRIDLTDDNRYRKDLFNYLKEQILNSELSKLFDLSNVNWEYIWGQSQKSKCIECWKLWNSGIHNVTEISRILNISRPTVITYLKRGTECGKCEYYINRRK